MFQGKFIHAIYSVMTELTLTVFFVVFQALLPVDSRTNYQRWRGRVWYVRERQMHRSCGPRYLRSVDLKFLRGDARKAKQKLGWMLRTVSPLTKLLANSSPNSWV